MKRRYGLLINCFLPFLGGNLSFYLLNKIICLNKNSEKGEKEKRYNQLYDNWMILLERGIRIEQYFYEKNINEIAIYGYGKIGKRLIAQLSQTGITVKYVIDERTGTTVEGIDRYILTDNFPKVDAVIITPVYEFKTINKKLKNKVLGEIISIDDIIYELL